MSANKRERYHHGDLRQALIEHATQAVREAGESKFSLRASARAVGVDIAAVYRHFPNKDGLLQQVAAVAFATLARRMEQRMEGVTDLVDRFQATGHAYIRFAVDEPELFRTAFGPRGAGSGDPAVRGAGDGGRDPYQLFFERLVDLHDAGIVPVSPEVASLPAWSAVHGLAYLLVDGTLGVSDVEEASRNVMDTVLAGLKASAAR